MDYRLLARFQATFRDVRYLHRDSSLGDRIAMEVYEDLYALGLSDKLKHRIDTGERLLNVANRRRGVDARRGDGTFGDPVPGIDPIRDKGYVVARGQIATVEIGIEVKILAKAMIKQIDRVASDLRGQVQHFKKGGNGHGAPLCIGVVGINWAEAYTSYEGDRAFPTDGKKYSHPVQEAAEAEKRLMEYARPHFDEFVVLRFRARNVEPYPFDWVDQTASDQDYGAAMTRISRAYDRRF